MHIHNKTVIYWNLSVYGRRIPQERKKTRSHKSGSVLNMHTKSANHCNNDVFTDVRHKKANNNSNDSNNIKVSQQYLWINESNPRGKNRPNKLICRCCFFVVVVRLFFSSALCAAQFDQREFHNEFVVMYGFFCTRCIRRFLSYNTKTAEMICRLGYIINAKLQSFLLTESSLDKITQVIYYTRTKEILCVWFLVACDW